MTERGEVANDVETEQIILSDDCDTTVLPSTPISFNLINDPLK